MKTGRGSPNYGTGRTLHASGYVRLWRPGHPLAAKDGYVMEHRLVLFEAGVDVPDDAHVHHRNGDKLDNRLTNLAVIDPAAHTRHHVREQGFVVNQHGVWPLLTPEERVERNRQRCRDYYHRVRKHKTKDAAA